MSAPTPDSATTTTATAAVRLVLDGRWHAERERARRDLTVDRFGPPPQPVPLEEHRALVTRQVLDLASFPHARSGLPVDQGGTGDHGASVTAFEMLGHIDLSLFVKAGVQYGLFLGAVSSLGTARHHEKYIDDIVAGRLMGCFAMTERGHGSDVQSLETTATYDAATGGLVISTPHEGARKDYIGNAARDGRMAAVFAQLVVAGENQGVHCILVPIRDESGNPLPGVTILDCEAKGGLPGVDNGELLFDDVRVPRANLLNRYGDIDDSGSYTSPIESVSRRFFTTIGTLVRGRISVAGGAGAATRNALAIAVRYGLQRRQFDDPDDPTDDDGILILNYLAHQRKLFPALARSYALQLAQNDLTSRMHDIRRDPDAADDHAQRELEARAAGIKAATTAHATATIQLCREACGGAGYMWENRLVALKGDSDVFTTFEGDNTVLLQLVAKGLLTNYAHDFESLDTVSTMLFVAKQFAGAVIEHTVGGSLVQRLITGAAGRDADNALSDRGGQLAVFEDRERHLLETLAARLRAGLSDEDTSNFEAFNQVQDHAIAAAVAHTDRILLDSFVTAIDAVPEGEARSLLDRVCDLFVFSTVETHRAWFLEHGRISAAQSKWVIARVNELCRQLRPDARTLVDAFAIPDAWLGAEQVLSEGAES